MSAVEHREDMPVGTKPKRSLRFVGRWELVLLAILAGICVINAFSSPYFLDIYNLMDSTQNFSEKAIIALSMALIIIGRDIDLSVASIIVLASTAMGFLASLGWGTPELVAAGIAVGALAGAFNGAIITRFEVPAIVVTIGTMSLFRGISTIVLGDGAYTSYPSDFWVLGQGYMFDLIPYEFIIFLVLAVLFTVLLHGTVIGRSLFAYGNNPQAALYSGVKVDTYRFWFFVLNGAMAGLAAVLFTSRIGSTRPNMALGWELEAVAMVVLGGVSIMGGSGTIPGIVISVFIVGMLTFGLGLLNIPGIIVTIIMGCLLIGAIAAPIVFGKLRALRH
ncbi:ABC transporter permease [Consotaella aegiceratis]|uniref:ABC transporter permease n=1 Tax=Consotaella aegiceratis TaxID=3097961 RepID=UPI002F40E7E6